MLAQSREPKDHARRVDVLVQRWLQDRQALMALMTAPALGEEQRALDASVPLHVQRLCEALMDYVSAGHFEIYDELLAEAEQRGSQHLAAALALYPQLQATTDVVLQFNDWHERLAKAGVINSLPQELAVLLPALEKRFGIEDRMIALLHEPSVATAV